MQVHCPSHGSTRDCEYVSSCCAVFVSGVLNDSQLLDPEGLHVLSAGDERQQMT